MIRAVLWDNDGLLLDSEAIFFNLTKSFFAEAGIHLDETYWGVEYLGNAKRTLQIAHELGMAADMVGPLVDRRNEAFVERIRHSVPLMPKVRETIDALFGQVSLGLVTGSPRDKVDLMHGANGLLERFDVIITEDDVRNQKPHPEPYLMALESLGLRPEECLALEDSRRGLSSAHAAGIPCIVVPNALTKVQRFELAYAVEEDVSGVLKHLYARNGHL
ncbi:MAG: HAD family phosphatase [Syntrophobacteraceae bacterium]|nr:HAD family phosphatase [Syntrophobacteraceae bacterium]